MTIVAEGAEKSEEVEILRTFGCDLVQGYVFARPTVAADALAVAWKLEGKEPECHERPAASTAASPAGPEFSVGDLNVASALYRALAVDLAKWPQVQTWLKICWDRPAAKKVRAMREK